MKQQHLDCDHEHRLNEERQIVACSDPIEYFEDRGEKHDERDIEREAGGGSSTMDGVDLVGIAGDGRRDDTGVALIRRTNAASSLETYNAGAMCVMSQMKRDISKTIRLPRVSV